MCVQVVQKKEAHDYRCLFRVCFMPKNLQTLLDQDPTSFMYLYLQVDPSMNFTLNLIACFLFTSLHQRGFSASVYVSREKPNMHGRFVCTSC